MWHGNTVVTSPPNSIGHVIEDKYIHRNVGIHRNRPGRHSPFIKSHPKRGQREGQEMGFLEGAGETITVVTDTCFYIFRRLLKYSFKTLKGGGAV